MVESNEPIFSLYAHYEIEGNTVYLDNDLAMKYGGAASSCDCNKLYSQDVCTYLRMFNSILGSLENTNINDPEFSIKLPADSNYFHEKTLFLSTHY